MEVMWRVFAEVVGVLVEVVFGECLVVVVVGVLVGCVLVFGCDVFEALPARGGGVWMWSVPPLPD